MKYLEDLVSHLIETARRDEQEKQRKDKPLTLANFKVEVLVKALVAPCHNCAKHHRSREQYYTQELQRAESVLRERGVSVEAVDPTKGYAVVSHGNYASGAVAFSNNPSQTSLLPKFEARVDQNLMGDVNRAKDKMIEHGRKALDYEKYARAFACAPSEARIELSIDDIHYFRLEK